MPDQLRDIVGRMVAAGESEDDIAAVIQRLSASEAAPTQTPLERMEQRLTDDGYGSVVAGMRGGGLSSATPTMVGQAAQHFAPGVSRALKSGAEKMYGGLLKAKDATIERFPTVVRDLIDSGAAIAQGGRRKVIEGLRRVGDEKQALLNAADKRASIPRESMRRGLDDVLDKAIESSDTPVKDMNKLAQVERDLIPDSPGVAPSHADKLKSKMQAESDRAFRQMKMGTRVTDIGARARTGVARSTKEALEAVEPKLTDVNARYASGKGQAEALREALKRADKHSVVGMSDLLGGTLGAAMGPAGIPAGVAAMRLFNNPNIGSRVAIGIDRAARIPRIDELSKAALLALLSGSDDQ
jgi:hypothetical protein